MPLPRTPRLALVFLAVVGAVVGGGVLALRGTTSLSGAGGAEVRTPGYAFPFRLDLEAARAEARERETLLLVYVGRDRPPCPGCVLLQQRVFSRPESAVLAERWVAAKVLGGEHLTPEGAAFLDRHRVRGYPTLLAMTPAGGVVASDLARRAQDVATLVAAMEEAEGAERAFAEHAREVERDPDGGALSALAERRRARGEVGEALALYERAVAAAPTPEVYEPYVALLMQEGERARARDALDAMLAAFPGHERGIEWRVLLAVVDLPASAPPEGLPALAARHAEALEALRALREREGDRVGEALVRARLATLERVRGDRTAAATHAQRALELTVHARGASEARMLLADLARERGDLADAIRWLEAEVSASPQGEAAAFARDALPALRAARDARLDGAGALAPAR